MANPLTPFKKKLLHGEEVTLDFVGDSITWGLNHCAPEETFVAIFAELFAEKFQDHKVLRYDGIVESEALPISYFEGPIAVGGKKGKEQAVIVRNGVGGNTVRRAINRKEDFLGAMPNGKIADLTFLMFGINDALSSDKSKFVTPEVFETDYEELLSLLGATGTLPLLISPTYNGTKYPLDDYVSVCARLADKHGLPYFDAHALWKTHFKEGEGGFGQGNWLSDSKTDACHFSPEGARQTGRFLFEKFAELLSRA